LAFFFTFPAVLRQKCWEVLKTKVRLSLYDELLFQHTMMIMVR